MVMDRPIIFSAPMVRAILAGQKTQTRRVLRNPPSDAYCRRPYMVDGTAIFSRGSGALFEASWQTWRDCPYGQRGDRLWVRETWAANEGYDRQPPRSIPAKSRVWFHETPNSCSIRGRWRPSIHMPRWASRITLSVVAVRVERLQSITEADARAEGIRRSAVGVDLREAVYHVDGWPESEPRTSAVGRYRDLWDSLNAKRGHPWASDPWVFVVEFRRLVPPREE